MANEVKFTVKLKVEGQEKVVEATAKTEDLCDAIGEVREASEHVGSGKGWETLMLGINSAMEVMQKMKGAVDSLANDYESWETAMASVNTMAGRDAAGLAELKEQVSALGREIPKTKEELADGLYQVISNGVPEADWIGFLEQSARASVGGIADLGETVKVTSTVIKNYGMEWTQAGEIQDKIQMTAKNGVTSFGELAAALPRVTANAATLGVSVDELMATFATLTGVSGNTAEVSTQLAAVFTALVKPSSEAVQMAQEMGIQFDAAAIKASGGMNRFLSTLDDTVKKYAQAHGMLEQEIYGKLFGSAESLRALTPLMGNLKDKFVENIGAMSNATGTITDSFGTMADTSASRMQMLKNTVRDMLEPLAGVASACRPVVDGLVSVGQVGLGVWSVVQSVKALRESNVLATASTIAHTAATRVLGTVSAATGISVTALKTAIRGLMIATGVGAAIAALGFVIEKLVGASKDASDSMRGLKDAENEAIDTAQQGSAAYGKARAQIEMTIATLKDFKGTKEEERQKVEELNATYGGVIGRYSTVSKWYQALCQNSEAYCQQMQREAEIAAYTKQLEGLYEKKHQAEKYKAMGDAIIDAQKGRMGRDAPAGLMADLEGRAKNGQNAVDAIDKQIGGVVSKIKALSDQKPDIKTSPVVTTPTGTATGKNTPSTTNSNTNTGPVLTTDAKTMKQLSDNVAYYQAAIEKADKSDEESLKTLVAKKVAAEQLLEAYKKLLTGMEEMAGYNKDAKTVAEINKNIGILQHQLEDMEPNSDTYKALTKEIERWQEKLSTTADKGSIAAIEERIQKLNERLHNEPLTMEAAVRLTVERDKMQKALDDNAKRLALEVKLATGDMSDFKEWSEKWKKEREAEEKSKVGEALQKQKDKLKDIGSLVSNVGQSFASLGKDIDAPVLQAAGILANAIATIIQGYATATAQAASMGPWAWAAFSLSGLAQVASVVAQVKEIGKFAHGGIAYGPTLGLFGEYAGASHNPEVVAPLDRLRSLVGPGDSVGGKVVFEIKGRRLLGVLQKEIGHIERG